MIAGGKKMAKYKMWIDNKWVEAASGKTYKVVNPATEEEIAQLPLADRRSRVLVDTH